ncbi:MAG: bifunctional DNA-formamidopyrimidine glycosylase/DNA-(apurinic or apyrimidinic site) lyase [Caldilineaceae bacterium]
MPELPEVETYLQELTPALRGRCICGGTVRWPRTIERPDVTTFLATINGFQFVDFARRGKYMLLGLDHTVRRERQTLIIHLRMTGHVTVYDKAVAPDKHTHVILDLTDGGQVHFQDSRKFGRLWLVSEPEEILSKLGPEPLSEDFVAAEFAQRLTGRSATIKALLLDQSIVAGVGNIYADESLYLAGIHPARTGDSLAFPEVLKLQQAIQTILAQAIAGHGSSLGGSSIQNYQRPSGEPGSFQEQHRVFQRTGQPCATCGTQIQRIVITQRSTHFCPTCQPAA